MKRKYIKAKPSREGINPEDIVDHVSSLHKIQTMRENAALTKINPFSNSNSFPTFEFLAISEGPDMPVEFYYGTAEEHINTLKNKITTAYPSSFDVDVVEIDVLKKVIPPKIYTPQDFAKRVKNGELYFKDNITGSPEDITGESTNGDGGDKTHSEVEENGEKQATENGEHNWDIELRKGSHKTEKNPDPGDDNQEVRTAVNTDGERVRVDPEEFDGVAKLKEIDPTLVEQIGLPTEVDTTPLEAGVDEPQWTEDGDIMARPTLEHGEPIVTKWHGKSDRRKDWMTTLKMFSKVASPRSDDIQGRAPLASLIQHLAESDLPIAFQVVFEKLEDWSQLAENRKQDLHLHRDTWGQKIKYEIGEIVHEESKERRREKKRDYMERVGESANTHEETPSAGKVGERRELMDNKIPKRTFRTNIRAVSVANDDVPKEKVKETMENISTVLDHLDGYFYGVDGEILEDSDGLVTENNDATKEFHRFINRDVITGSGKRRPDIVANADELSNFIAVPSSTELTVEGVRGTRADPKSRDPLPKPDPEMMEYFHQPGMRIGYALDKEASEEEVPTQIPPKNLPTHYGRFGMTGVGKSKALINDIISLYENTSGPTIVIDPKGDGMPENLMKVLYDRFGEKDMEENVIHFPIPEILPAFSFFDIEESLRYKTTERRDRELLREDIIQQKVDHYEELLKLFMGEENYNDAKVAPIMISALIKSLYDKYYVEGMIDGDPKHGLVGDGIPDRDSYNAFSHRHLEEIAELLYRKGAWDEDDDEDKQGEIPDISDDRIKSILKRYTKGDEHSFTVVMEAVFNRINNISQDTHLQKIFDNTEAKFDFRDHLNEDNIILFDLGEMREGPTRLMTGLILSNLWDALQDHDKCFCKEGHEDLMECQEIAEKNGLNRQQPHCRESWGDDHVVNVIIDEAASVTVSDFIDKMLEQGRSFNLSVGLSMQYPQQMQQAGTERTYNNVLNNVESILLGRIDVDEKIAETMANEQVSKEEFKNRIKSLPPGEWLAKLPSPEFRHDSPPPFSLSPLPIPAGHPEAEHKLTTEATQRFNHIVRQRVHEQTEQEYGIERQTSEKEDSPNQRDEDVGKERLSTPDDENKDGDDGSTADDDDNSGSDDSEDDMQVDVNDLNVGKHTADGGAVGKQQEPFVHQKEDDDDPLEGIRREVITDSQLPDHIEKKGGVLECLHCGSAYGHGEPINDILSCCTEELILKSEKAERSDQDSNRETVTSTELSMNKYGYGGKHNTATLTTDYVTHATRPNVNENLTITGYSDISEVFNKYDPYTIKSVASAIVSVCPPKYQSHRNILINSLLDLVKDNDTIAAQFEIDLSQSEFAEAIAKTPPAPIDIEIQPLLNEVEQQASGATQINPHEVEEWEQNPCSTPCKRFYSSRKLISGDALAKQGVYGKVPENPSRVEPDRLSPHEQMPSVYAYPESDDEAYIQTMCSPVKQSGVSVPESKLEEYDINREEAAFLTALGKAYNNDLDGYSLAYPMTHIRTQYDVHTSNLQDKGLVKTKKLYQQRTYYALTDDGWDVIVEDREWGQGKGDKHDELVHRLGAQLFKTYYEYQNPEINVVSFVKDGQERLDVQMRVDYNYEIEDKDEGTKHNGTGEIEASGMDESEHTGTKNYDHIVEDAELMADNRGKAIWVAENRDIVKTILSALSNNNDIPVEVDDDVIEAVENGAISHAKMNDTLEDSGYEGIDKIITYREMWKTIPQP